VDYAAGPGDRVSRDAWRAAENDVGVELSAALREAYLLFGRRPDLTSRQNRLIPPTSSTSMSRAVSWCSGWRTRAARSGAWQWRTWPAPIPVCIRDRDSGDWEPFLDRVSVACAEMVLNEVVIGRGHLGDMCDLPGGLIAVAESAYTQLALPEYRLWADRGITVRWFSAPGKLLRMDGRGPRGWLLAAGQTLADLDAIRAAIPGPWIRRQRPGLRHG
jgi:hypothetical protein